MAIFAMLALAMPMEAPPTQAPVNLAQLTLPQLAVQLAASSDPCDHQLLRCREAREGGAPQPAGWCHDQYTGCRLAHADAQRELGEARARATLLAVMARKVNLEQAPSKPADSTTRKSGYYGTAPMTHRSVKAKSLSLSAPAGSELDELELNLVSKPAHDHAKKIDESYESTGKCEEDMAKCKHEKKREQYGARPHLWCTEDFKQCRENEAKEQQQMREAQQLQLKHELGAKKLASHKATALAAPAAPTGSIAAPATARQYPAGSGVNSFFNANYEAAMDELLHHDETVR